MPKPLIIANNKEIKHGQDKYNRRYEKKNDQMIEKVV
ncbi:hypothetical protein N568_0100005 [Lactococcus garvieae TRF1]|uniref:Uncharacterized protein n=1 Tax=Lactococcus garvieae TRF1 TaxID=1380772 RepID=V8ATF2_9LACT|nr:hypothetical protein N568_0100005 [Lactococcus garvieae TRF1]